MISLLRFGLARRALFVAFLVGLALQVSVLSLRGTTDVISFKSWALHAVDVGVFSAYTRPAPDPQDPDAVIRPDYPPLSIIGLWSLAKAALAMDPDMNVFSRRLTVLIKGLLLVSRVAVFLLMLWIGFRVTGDPTTAWTVGLAVWFNPALILNGAALGYLDPLCWAPGVAAVVATSRGHHKLGGVLLGIAMLTKHQGMLFGFPVLAAVGRNWSGAVRMLAACALTLAVVTAPFVLVGTPTAFIAGLKINLNDRLVSGNALNLWWLVTLAIPLAKSGIAAVYLPARFLELAVLIPVLGFDPKPWTTAFVVGATLWMYARVSREPSLAAAAAMAALTVHTYFMFAVSVHENHLVGAIPFAGLAAIYWPKYWRVFWALTVMAALNQYLFYGLGRDFDNPMRTGWFWVWTAGLSGINFLMWIGHAWLFYRRGGQSMTRPRFRRFRWRRDRTRVPSPTPNLPDHLRGLAE